MAGYLPAAAAERAAQYAALGLSGPEALYREISSLSTCPRRGTLSPPGRPSAMWSR